MATTKHAVSTAIDESPPVSLKIVDLDVRYAISGGYLHAVDRVRLELEPGQTLGLVGESGCGKSTVAKAILRLLPSDALLDGEIHLDGEDVLGMSSRRLQEVRWTKLALVTQSAMNSLDPVYRVGEQIVESILAHQRMSKEAAWARASELFELVGLEPDRLRDYPHQFSGGMRQRAVIAMALSLNAGLLIADEPTTALDSIMQDQVLGQIEALQARLERSMLLVTHDIAVVAESCERVAVMYAGQIVETGTTAEVLHRPFHPYTMGLKNAFPTMDPDQDDLISIPGTLPSLVSPPTGCRFAARCPFSTDHCIEVEPPLQEVEPGHAARCHYPERAPELRELVKLRETWEPDVTPSAERPGAGDQLGGLADWIKEAGPTEDHRRPTIEATGLTKHFELGGGLFAAMVGKKPRVIRAVQDVDVLIRSSEVVGLVGESGSGKSTLGMTLVHLYGPTGGNVEFEGERMDAPSGAQLKEFRRNAQFIFQDPYGSLNPRLTVAQLVEEPLKVHGIGSDDERRTKVADALEHVRVPARDYLRRYPHELSGGLRQRIAIARAIVMEPRFIVADEPVSMLDVSTQAGILHLIRDLSAEMGLAVLYVSHDIATVRYICDRVAVMYHGRFVEHGPTARILAHPLHSYTRRLMAAVPSADPESRRARIAATEELILDAGQGDCPEPGPHWTEPERDHFVACEQHG